MKKLNAAEILDILKAHAADEEAHQEAQGIRPEQAEAQRRKALEPDRCRQCGDILAPYFDGGRLRSACFTCDDGPTTR